MRYRTTIRKPLYEDLTVVVDSFDEAWELLLCEIGDSAVRMDISSRQGGTARLANGTVIFITPLPEPQQC